MSLNPYDLESDLVTACENDLDAERMKRREAEALVNANTDHMTEVGVELCRERDARISELEAENQLVKDDFDRMQRECKHEKIRAEQAEAALAELRNAVQRLVDESSSVWSNKALRAARTVDLLLARAEEGME